MRPSTRARGNTQLRQSNINNIKATQKIRQERNKGQKQIKGKEKRQQRTFWLKQPLSLLNAFINPLLKAMQRLSGFVLSCSDYPPINSSDVEDGESRREAVPCWSLGPALINAPGDDTNYCLPARQLC